MKIIFHKVYLSIILLPVLAVGFIPLAPTPTMLASTWQAARLAEARGKYIEAVEYYKILLDLQPEKINLWKKIGDLEIEAGHNEDAILAYQSALQKESLSIEGIFTLAGLFQSSGSNDQALGLFQSLAESGPLPEDMYPQLVKVLRQEGDLGYAIIAAENWYKTFPKNLQAQFAVALLQLPEDPHASLNILRELADGEKPLSPHAKVLVDAISPALEKDNAAYARVIIGQALAVLGEWDIAEKAFTVAVQISDNYAEAWALLSDAQQHLGKDGSSALARAVELNPESDIVRAVQALTWRRAGQPRKALPYYQILANSDPGNPNWLLEMGATLVEAGDLIEALRYYQKATRLAPNNPAVWRALAQFSAANGYDPEDFALPAVERALALDPDGLETLTIAGYVNLIAGNLTEGEQFLQQALAVDADYPPALLTIAQLYINKNLPSQARLYLEKAAAQSENPTVAEQAGRLLERITP